MLTTNFNKMFELRAIKEPYTYLIRNGFSRAVAWRICQDNYVKIDLYYLEMLCNLLHCTPHDVIEWTPENESENYEQHPLFILKSKKKSSNISKLLEQFPVERMEELEKLMEEMKLKRKV